MRYSRHSFNSACLFFIVIKHWKQLILLTAADLISKIDVIKKTKIRADMLFLLTVIFSFGVSSAETAPALKCDGKSFATRSHIWNVMREAHDRKLVIQEKLEDAEREQERNKAHYERTKETCKQGALSESKCRQLAHAFHAGALLIHERRQEVELARTEEDLQSLRLRCSKGDPVSGQIFHDTYSRLWSVRDDVAGAAEARLKADLEYHTENYRILSQLITQGATSIASLIDAEFLQKDAQSDYELARKRRASAKNSLKLLPMLEIGTD